jgi:predicted permease
VLIALIYEAMGILLSLTVKQLFWVPHRFRYGILVAGGWSNIGDIREFGVMLISDPEHGHVFLCSCLSHPRSSWPVLKILSNT